MMEQQCFLLLKATKSCTGLFYRLIKRIRIMKPMGHQRTSNLLSEISESRFVTKK